MPTASPRCLTSCAPFTRLPKRRPPKSPRRKSKKGVGITIGIYGCGLDGADGAEAWVELTKDGVTIYNTWQDHGQGADMGARGHGA